MAKTAWKIRGNSRKHEYLLYLLETEVKNPNIYTYIHTAYTHTHICSMYVCVYTHTHKHTTTHTNTYTHTHTHTHTPELGYNDLGLCDISVITLHILWYQLIPHMERVFLPCLVRNTYEHLPRI
jgi:hypothetical protein